MKLYLIRHGESLDDIEDRFGGFANYPLTENGLAKVGELAKSLEDSGIQKVFTSPYLRAYDAAKIIAEQVGAEFEVEMDIRERNTYGFLSGMRKDFAKENFPDDYANSKDRRTAESIDGSEKYSDVVARAQRFVKKVRSSGFNVVGMVSHSKFFDVLQREVLRLKTIHKPSDCGYIVVDLNSGNIEEVVNAKVVE